MTSRIAVWIALVFALSCSAARVGSAPDAAAHRIVPYDPGKARAASQIEDPEQATRAYLDAVPPERRALTRAYANGHYLLWIADVAVCAAVLIALLATGLSVRFRDRARRITRVRVLQTALYWLQFFLVVSAVRFPLELYASYFHERRYGLLTQALPAFLIDRARAVAIGCVVGALAMAIVYAVLRRARRRWWLWLSGMALVFAIVGMAMAPVLIMPMFERFTPIENRAIRTDILRMAHDHGIPADEVYQVDASRRTDRISAYVVGMLGTTRIVMFDTTLQRCTPEQIETIMGHEMGHYVLNHVGGSVGFVAVVIGIGLLFVQRGLGCALRRWPRSGIEDAADLAGMPLLALLCLAAALVASPIVNTYFRRHEAEADAFGLDAIRQPDAAATTYLTLGEYRDLDPPPLIEALFFDHPSGRSRILSAMEWKRAHATAPPP